MRSILSRGGCNAFGYDELSKARHQVALTQGAVSTRGQERLLPALASAKSFRALEARLITLLTERRIAAGYTHRGTNPRTYAAPCSLRSLL